MTEQIARTLNTLVSPVLPFFYSEAVTKDVTYGTYDLRVTEERTKDGSYRITGEVTIRVYSDSLPVAEGHSDTIRGLIEQHMNDGMFRSRFVRRDEDRTSDIWTVETQYIIKQYS